jgi:hypothetical protein
MRALEAGRILDVKRIRVHIVIKAFLHMNRAMQEFAEEGIPDLELDRLAL